ncbi:MAG: barstar family protein [Acidobacteriaceae bacterium]|nr:barstar family protein [Acidobacteriaceae bacterium]
MAIFTTAEADNQQLDWTILRDGGVNLYWRQEILADDLKWLKSNGYRVVTFEAAEWESERRMHESLKVQLSFPEYYGNNLNALDECMLDDLVVPDSGGLAIVLNHYDRFSKPSNHVASDERSTGEVLLSVFAKAVRHHMLFGRRLLILVQSDDPQIEFGRLGGVAAWWNQREWLNKNRGL